MVVFVVAVYKATDFILGISAQHGRYISPNACRLSSVNKPQILPNRDNAGSYLTSVTQTEVVRTKPPSARQGCLDSWPSESTCSCYHHSPPFSSFPSLDMPMLSSQPHVHLFWRTASHMSRAAGMACLPGCQSPIKYSVSSLIVAQWWQHHRCGALQEVVCLLDRHFGRMRRRTLSLNGGLSPGGNYYLGGIYVSEYHPLSPPINIW